MCDRADNLNKNVVMYEELKQVKDCFKIDMLKMICTSISSDHGQIQ